MKMIATMNTIMNVNMNVSNQYEYDCAYAYGCECAHEYEYAYEYRFEGSLGICVPALASWPSAQLLTWLVGWLIAWPRPRHRCRPQSMNMDMHLNKA